MGCAASGEFDDFDPLEGQSEKDFVTLNRGIFTKLAEL
jgi:hypothetical protein